MTQQPSTARGTAAGSGASPADSWLEPEGEREPALAPWWLPIGPGTPIDDLPDLQDVWVDLWPAPKQPWRRRALGALVPTVVLVLVTALVVSLAAYAYRPAEPRDRTYLPVDGAYAQVSLNGTAGQLEQAVVGGAGVISLGEIGAAAAPSDLIDWAVDHDLWIADATTTAGKLRVVFVVDRSSVSLLGVLTATDVAAFQPALPVSRGTEGSRRTTALSGQFSAPSGQLGSYTADTQVVGSGDCFDWSAAITTTIAGAQPLALTLNVCRRTGLQQFGFHRAGQPALDLTVTGRQPAAGRFEGTIETPAVTQTAVAGWRPTKVSFRSKDAAGTNPVFNVITRPPLVLGDHQFVLLGVDNSLTMYTVDQTSATLAWTAHPGGRISQLRAAGDLIIAATDQRRLIAYDLAGRRVWQIDLPDLVADLAQSGDRLVASIFTGVVLAIDVRTGSQLWRQEFDTVKSTPGLAVSDQIVAFSEGDSTVHALDLGDGEDQGSTSGATINGIGADGRSLIMLRSDRLLRTDTTPNASRTTLDLDTQTGISAAMVVTGTVAVVRGATEVVVVDLTAGAIVARGPAAVADLAAGPGAVLITRSDAATVITPTNPTGTAFTIDASMRSTGTPDAGISSWGAVVVYHDNAVVIM